MYLHKPNNEAVINYTLFDYVTIPVCMHSYKNMMTSKETIKPFPELVIMFVSVQASESKISIKHCYSWSSLILDDALQMKPTCICCS